MKPTHHNAAGPIAFGLAVLVGLSRIRREPAIRPTRKNTGPFSRSSVQQCLPPPTRTQSHNPIDRFVTAKLDAEGIKPVPPADRRTLIRRLYLDLIGLPPTPLEVQDFLDDRSPDAVASVVDRLLASPHYGERCGRATGSTSSASPRPTATSATAPSQTPGDIATM